MQIWTEMGSKNYDDGKYDLWDFREIVLCTVKQNADEQRLNANQLWRDFCTRDQRYAPYQLATVFCATRDWKFPRSKTVALLRLLKVLAVEKLFVFLL